MADNEIYPTPTEGDLSTFLPFINVNEGVARLGKNTKLFAKLLNNFLANETIAELKTHVANGDAEAAQGAAHTIKGVCANLSLTKAFEQALVVETQLRAKEIDASAAEELERVLTKTKEYIRVLHSTAAFRFPPA